MSSRSEFFILPFVILLIVAILPMQVVAVSPNSISVSMSPENPAPQESTTISLSSYEVNLDGVSISWFENGKKISSGIGVKSFSATAPRSGETSTIRALINFPDGEVEKKIIIRPNVMVLLWQATDSYVPPFYRGKALPTADSSIKVVAMPEIKSSTGMIGAKNMLYNWRRNYSNDVASSGYGKNSFSFAKDYLEDRDNISVSASSIDGQYTSQANINIETFEPQISFYKNDAREGTIWERALRDGHKIAGEEIIVAEPYFISPKELRSPRLLWNWFINGSLTNNTLEYKGNWLPVKIEGAVSGIANIGLQIENREQLFGEASKEINVEF